MQPACFFTWRSRDWFVNIIIVVVSVVGGVVLIVFILAVSIMYYRLKSRQKVSKFIDLSSFKIGFIVLQVNFVQGGSAPRSATFFENPSYAADVQASPVR